VRATDVRRPARSPRPPEICGGPAGTALIIPIGVAAAGEIGVDFRPVLMSTAVAAAAALLTPVTTPVNLMIME
jgi:di/tricarboxylate transporter